MKARDYTDDDDLSRGLGDGDMYGYPGQARQVGVDQPQIQHTEDPIADWVTHPSNQWELGDQMADHSDDQEYMEEE